MVRVCRGRMRCLLQLHDMGCVDVGSHWRRTSEAVVTWMGDGVDKDADSHWDAMLGRVVGPRCDVCAGSKWGTGRDGRGHVAAIVGGTRLWDG